MIQLLFWLMYTFRKKNYIRPKRKAFHQEFCFYQHIFKGLKENYVTLEHFISLNLADKIYAPIQSILNLGIEQTIMCSRLGIDCEVVKVSSGMANCSKTLA